MNVSRSRPAPITRRLSASLIHDGVGKATKGAGVNNALMDRQGVNPVSANSIFVVKLIKLFPPSRESDSVERPRCQQAIPDRHAAYCQNSGHQQL